MNLILTNTKRFLFICLMISSIKSHAQDSTFKYTLQTYSPDILLPKWTSLNFFFDCLYHTPSKKDRQRYAKYKYLIDQKPTTKNHQLYYSLACSLWELEKTAAAEKMFLTIINSKAKYYSSTYYHSSDIPGDTTTNIYGYGSYTSNYKNYAAIHLTKIYLEQKKFDKALQYLEDATHKYKVSYSCGTGYLWQKNEYDFLYASCYEGLNRHADVLDLLLPGCLDRNDDIIIAAIKNSYSQKEIQDELQKAEHSIQCTIDTFPSFSYQTTGSGKKEKTDTLTYFSGTATLMLFNKQVNIPVPSLENNERMTKERFIGIFKDSDLYAKLKEYN